MNDAELNLPNAPIVEAVVDIDCDMPPDLDLATVKNQAHVAFASRYPKSKTLFLERHRFDVRGFEVTGVQPSVHAAERAIQALQFLHDDGRQLVQVRAQGFSFNRLAPYTRLHDYLPEIERTWSLFRGIASPVQVRVVRLRYINRILLPMVQGRVELDDYLKLRQRLPDEGKLKFLGFLSQQAAVEVDTGHQANIVLSSQPAEGDKFPLIFDNCVEATGPAEPENWPWILGKLQSLRGLKNRIFEQTLTPQCLTLFQK